MAQTDWTQRGSVSLRFLPDDIREEFRDEQPRRFLALFDKMREVYSLAKSGADPSVDITDLIKYELYAARQFPLVRAALPPDTLKEYALFLLDVGFGSESMAVVQNRFLKAASLVLSLCRRKLFGRLTLDWRPMYDTATRLLLEPGGEQGARLATLEVLLGVVRAARYLFPPAAAREIWAELAPGIRRLHTKESFESLALLVHLLPTEHLGQPRAVAAAGVEFWDQLLEEAVALSSARVHNRQWTKLWLSLVAHAASADTRGFLQWDRWYPKMAEQIMWLFDVPVGTASEVPEVAQNSPSRAECFVGRGLAKTRTVGLVARLTVHCVGKAGGAMADIATLCRLLEQYYYPSNHGSWSDNLAEFLFGLALGLRARLVGDLRAQYWRHRRENGFPPPSGSSPDYGDDDDDEGADEGEGGDEMGSVGADLVEAEDEEEDLGGEGGNGVPTPSEGDGEPPPPGLPPRPRVQLSLGEQRELAAGILRLSLSAQYSKSGDLARDARRVLDVVAHVIPEVALPHLFTRFQRALEDVHAGAQLPWAVYSMAAVVRPMLIYGLPPEVLLPDDVDPEGRRVRRPWELSDTPGEALYPPGGEGLVASLDRGVGGQVVGTAMTALLPCLDAVDESKTRAAFKFYLHTLASIKRLPGDSSMDDSSPLPSPLGSSLDTEAWVTELLQRLFTLLEALDTGGSSRATDQSALGSSTERTYRRDLSNRDMLGQFLGMLASKLPPSLRTPVATKVAAFLTQASLLSVVSECYAVGRRLVGALDPDVATKRLLLPLLESVASDLEDIATRPPREEMPSGLERLLLFRLGILPSAFCLMLGSEDQAALLRQHGPLLYSAIDAAFRCRSVAVMQSAMNTLGLITWTLGAMYPVLPREHPSEVLPGSGLEPFLSLTGRVGGATGGEDARSWDSVRDEYCPVLHRPSGEEVGMLGEIFTRTGGQAIKDLEDLASPSAPTPPSLAGLPLRLQVYSCLTRITCVLYYGGPMIADIPYEQGGGLPCGFTLSVTARDVFPGFREDMASRLVALLPFIRGQDAQAQATYASVLDKCFNPNASLSVFQRMFSGLCDKDLEDPPLSLYRITPTPLRPQSRWSPVFVSNAVIRGLIGPSALRGQVTTEKIDRSPEDYSPVEKAVVETLCRLGLSEYDQVRASAHSFLSRTSTALSLGRTMVVPRMLAAVRGEWDGTGDFPDSLLTPRGASLPIILPAHTPQKGPVVGALTVLGLFLGPGWEPMMRYPELYLETFMTVLLAESYGEHEIQKVLTHAGLLLASTSATSPSILLRGAGGDSRAKSVLGWLLRYAHHLHSSSEGGAAAAGGGGKQGTGDAGSAVDKIAALPPQTASAVLRQLMSRVAIKPEGGSAAAAAAVAAAAAAAVGVSGEGAAAATATAIAIAAPPAPAAAAVTHTARFLSLSLAGIAIILPALWLKRPGQEEAAAGPGSPEDAAMLGEVAGLVCQVLTSRHSTDALAVARAILHRLLVNYNSWMVPSPFLCGPPPSTPPKLANSGLAPLSHEAFRSALLTGLVQAPEGAQSLMEMLARERQLPQEVQSSRQQAWNALVNRPENLLGMALTSRYSILWFPSFRSLKGANKQMFRVYNSLLFESLFAAVGHQEMVAAFRPVVEKMLEKVEGNKMNGKGNGNGAGTAGQPPSAAAALASMLSGGGAPDDERGRWCVCAEFLTAVVSSGAAFCVDSSGAGGAGGAETYWDTWVCAALRRGFRNTPPELSSAWTVAVRYMVARLAWSEGRESPAALRSVLQMALDDVAPQGPPAPTPELARAAKRLAHCVEELCMHELSAASAAVVIPATTEAVRRLAALRDHPSQQVRAAAARGLSTSVALGPPSAEGAVQLHGAGLAAAAEELAAAVAAVRRDILSDLQRGSEAVARVSHAVGGNGNGTGAANGNGSGNAVTTPSPPPEAAMEVDGALPAPSAPEAALPDTETRDRLLSSLYYLDHQMMYHCRPRELQFYLDCIAAVVVLHESPVPQLQSITDSARVTLRRFKYLPLYGPLRESMKAVITQLSTGPQYWVRAFGLVLAQTTLWFRHALAFSPSDIAPLIALVEAALKDPKQEVREIASNTLSGLIRGLDGPGFRALATRFEKAAQRDAKRSAAAAKGTGPTMEEVAAAHSTVLGLRSFVLVSPYGIATWLPKVLMALVRAGSPPRAPPVVRRTAQQALAHFRGTHQDDKEELRRSFNEEEWDALLSVEPPASYIV